MPKKSQQLYLFLKELQEAAESTAERRGGM